MKRALWTFFCIVVFFSSSLAARAEDFYVIAVGRNNATGTAQPEDVLSGKTFSNSQSTGLEGTMPNIGHQDVTPGPVPQAISAGYHDGTGYVAGDANLVDGNIKAGTTIFGVTGIAVIASGSATDAQVLTGVSYSNASGASTGAMPDNGAATVMPGTSDQTIAAGYHNGSGTVVGDAALVASNIKDGTTIFGVTGIAVIASGSATDAQVLTGVSYSNASGASTGAMPYNEGDNASTAQAAAAGMNYLTAPTGFYDGNDRVSATDAQVASLDTDLVTGNIKFGVEIFGVAGNVYVVDTSSGDAVESDILLGKKAWVDGSEITGTANPSPIAKTGQTIPSGPRDDGELQKGVSWPSPRFTDNDDGTVTDNLTGLIWLRDANRFSTRLWFDALNACNSLAADGVDLRDGSTPGDWRLPNRKEMLSLVDLGNHHPALPSDHSAVFVNVQSSYYWTATTYASSLGDAWSVDLGPGSSTYGNKYTYSDYVWPVRDK